MKKRIVLIEDNADDAELTILGFKKNNPEIEIIHFKNGIEAIDFFQNADNDSIIKSLSLILLDINMPLINGLQVLEKIKSSHLIKWIPVVMLTSSIEERDIETSYAYGANSYLKKPVNFEEFLDLVKTLEKYWLSLNELPSA